MSVVTWPALLHKYRKNKDSISRSCLADVVGYPCSSHAMNHGMSWPLSWWEMSSRAVNKPWAVSHSCCCSREGLVTGFTEPSFSGCKRSRPVLWNAAGWTAGDERHPSSSWILCFPACSGPSSETWLCSCVWTCWSVAKQERLVYLPSFMPADASPQTPDHRALSSHHLLGEEFHVWGPHQTSDERWQTLSRSSQTRDSFEGEYELSLLSLHFISLMFRRISEAVKRFCHLSFLCCCCSLLAIIVALKQKQCIIWSPSYSIKIP